MIKIKSMSKSKSNQQTTNYRQQTIPTLRALLLALCLLTFTSTTTATIRYVSHTGSSTPPYTSWETAADSIQKAIDICEPGDTVLVANGVYYEALYIDKTIHLIGSSMDSTVIDGTDLGNYIVRFTSSGTFTNFTLLGGGDNFPNSRAIYSEVMSNDIEVKNCKISRAGVGIGMPGGDLIAINIIMTGLTRGINLFGRIENYVSNCIIVTDKPNAYGIDIAFTTNIDYYINNCIILYTGGALSNREAGISATFPKKLFIKNNFISGFNNNIRLTSYADTVVVENNILSYASPGGFGSLTSSSRSVSTQNLIIISNKTAIWGGAGSTLYSDYNLFWNNIINYSNVTPGDSDIVAYPMFVKDTLPNPQLDFDYHLQAYSPAIDKGNPEILDVDGSRSDMGMYGGPLGESYKYKDLAPKPPRNLSAVVDSSQILVKWNRNTEADTSHYNVYRDTVANFAIDSTKLISSQTDTFYVQYSPYQSSRYVYKITCVDKQGNESLPSEELVINITSLTMNDYPMTINDYLLYQNYPNPFNPSTTIAYKLKERAYVKLMVYDITGALVAVLVNKEQESGYYEVEFNGGNLINQIRTGDLASGIYLYRIEVIGEGRIPVYTEMKKMLLIK